jgi:hypothetical protein
MSLGFAPEFEYRTTEGPSGWIMVTSVLGEKGHAHRIGKRVHGAVIYTVCGLRGARQSTAPDDAVRCPDCLI